MSLLFLNIKSLKTFRVSLLILFDVFVFASAQEASVDSSVYNIALGVGDSQSAALGLHSVHLESDFNIFLNPSEITRYGTLYGEYFGSQGWGGATFPLQSGKLGVFLGKPYTGALRPGLELYDRNLYATNSSAALAYFGYDSEASQLFSGSRPELSGDFSFTPQLNILYGWQFSRSAFGLEYGLYRDQSKLETSAGDVVSINFIEHSVTLGHLLQANGKLNFWGSSLSVSLPSLDIGETTSAGENNLTLSEVLPASSLLLRPVFSLGDKRLILPLNAYFEDYTLEGSFNSDTSIGNRGTNETFSFSRLRYDVGFHPSLHIPYTENLVIIAALGVEYRVEGEKTIFGDNDYEEKVDLTSLSIPIGFSGEMRLSEKTLLRMGIQGRLYESHVLKSGENVAIIDEQEQSRNADSFSLSTGLGLKLTDDLDLDLGLNTGSTASFNLNNIISTASLRMYY